MCEPNPMEVRVIEGAGRAIERYGWRGSTLERIAGESGLSRMTLHRHGLGRDEIFALLGRAYERDFRTAVADACSKPRQASERLRGGLRAVCDTSERHLGFLAGLDEEADTRLFHDAGRSRSGFIAPIETVLRDGIADGSFRRVPIATTATLLVNAADRTYRHLRLAHRWTPARSRSAIDLLVAGLTASPPPAGSRGGDSARPRPASGRRSSTTTSRTPTSR
jgi:AcrR family transcriptional regulator